MKIDQMTAAEHKTRSDRSSKLLLLVAMVSMIMIFAGLTSAFVVSKSRGDWLKDFQLPASFFWSTLVIVVSSLTFHFAKVAIRKDNKTQTSLFLVTTLLLGILFVVLQFQGFGKIVDAGYYFTGPQSAITTTFLFVVAVVHLAHLLVGLICIFVINIKHFLNKYSSGSYLGIELGVMFWHFLDLLWVYLFLFLYFFK